MSFDPHLSPQDHYPEAVSHDLHGARSVACPFCHAQPGEPCHARDGNSEIHVHRDHQARFDAYEQLRPSGH